MTDYWDIARYVESHPDDTAQRWRLAKKLYMAWEYRLALEHLQVLKNEQPEKLNMRRYLAATYFRLGRYDESLDELAEMLEQWPDEISVREQYARTLEVAGNARDAATVWKEIAKDFPDHPLASRAAKRLSKRADQKDGPRESLRLHDSDSGIDIRRGLTCPECGVQNSAEFERCWQCHSPLSPEFAPTPPPMRRPSAPAAPEIYSWIAMAFLVVMCALDFYLTIRQFEIAQDFVGNEAVERSFELFLRNSLVVTQAVMGLALFAVFPLGLWLALVVSLPEVDMDRRFTIGSLAAAGFAYALTFLPGVLFMLSAVAAAAGSFAVIAILASVPLSKKIGAWLIHGCVVSAALLAVFAVADDWRALPEFRTIMRYAESQTPGEPSFSKTMGSTPIRVNAVWPSTGSRWLDGRSMGAELELISKNPDANFDARLIHESTIVSTAKSANGRASLIQFPVTPGSIYRFEVTGAENVPIEMRAYGPLVLEFTQ